MKKLIALALVFLMLPCAALAESLSLYYVPGGEGQETFIAAHPDVAIVTAKSEDYLFSTEEMAGLLVTHDFRWDVFSVKTGFGNPHLLMRKGYCLDLTASEAIRSQHARLWPGIAQRCEQDGRIYAVPTGIDFDMMIANKEVFDTLGYGESDVPQSFPQLLDFLEGWLKRIDEEPENVVVWDMLDDSVYDRNTYPRLLVDQLITDYIRQRQFAGAPLRFDDPDLPALLTRTRAVGQAIYQAEKGSHERPALLQNASGSFIPWGSIGPWHIPMRMHDDQPRLMCGMLDTVVVNAGTAVPELAIAMVESLATHAYWLEHTPAFLFRDAEPIENPEWAADAAIWRAGIDVVENALAHPDWPLADCADLTVLPADRPDTLNTLQHWYTAAHDDPDIAQLNDLVDSWKTYLADETTRWIVSPEALKDYQTFAPTLFFPLSDAFNASTPAGQNLVMLTRRFADGEIDAEKLVSELDRLAQMVLMEEQ